jgi:hypothetical protein
MQSIALIFQNPLPQENLLHDSPEANYLSDPNFTESTPPQPEFSFAIVKAASQPCHTLTKRRCERRIWTDDIECSIRERYYGPFV